MTQQLSLFPEAVPDQPAADMARPSTSAGEASGHRARWDQRLDSFENWLRSLNKAKFTIRGYSTDVQQLLPDAKVALKAWLDKYVQRAHQLQTLRLQMS